MSMWSFTGVKSTVRGLQNSIAQVAQDVDETMARAAAGVVSMKKSGGQNAEADREAELYKEMLVDFQINQAKLTREIQAVLREKDDESQRWRQLYEGVAGAEAVAAAEASAPPGVNSAQLPTPGSPETLKEDPNSFTVTNASTHANGGLGVGSVAEIMSEENIIEARLRAVIQKTVDDAAVLGKKERTIAALEDKLKKLEAKYLEVMKVQTASETRQIEEMKALETREVSSLETVENLVVEYNKLTTESDQRRQTDLATIKNLENIRDELQTKLKAHENNIMLLLEDKEEAGRGEGALSPGRQRRSSLPSAELSAELETLRQKVSELQLAEEASKLAEEAAKKSQSDLVLQLEQAKAQLEVHSGTVGEAEKNAKERAAELVTLRAEVQALKKAAESGAQEAQTAKEGRERAETELTATVAKMAALTATHVALEAESSSFKTKAAADSSAGQEALKKLQMSENALKACGLELEDTKKKLKEAQKSAEETEERANQAAADVTLMTQELQKVTAENATRGLDLEALRKELGAIKVAMEAKAKESAAAESAVQAAKDETEKMKALLATSHARGSELQKALAEATGELTTAQEAFVKESRARKTIHNKLMELQGNIRVNVRVRPVLDVEHRSGQDSLVTEFPSEDEIVVAKEEGARTQFEFDRVFTPSSTQVEVFDSVQSLITSVLDGYDVTIFAYGQTGAGKSHTMEGTNEDPGVNTRALMSLFATAAQRAGQTEYTFNLSMFEIYNEAVYDLLDPELHKPPTKGDKGERERGKGLEIRQAPNGIVVSGLSEVAISGMDEVKTQLDMGRRARAVGSHDMNEHSSRSHMIFRVRVSGKDQQAGGSEVRSVLNLIDLAGSERVGKTEATGERLKEAQNINRSLSALGDVISALGSRSKGSHIPFRNSKLTFLLQDSLTGGGKLLMFVNVSPAAYNAGETLCSLNFASRCRAVELGVARRNADSPDVARLKRVIDTFQNQLISAGITPADVPPPEKVPSAAGTPAGSQPGSRSASPSTGRRTSASGLPPTSADGKPKRGSQTQLPPTSPPQPNLNP